MTCRKCQRIRRRVAEFMEGAGHALFLSALVTAVFLPWILGASIALDWFLGLLWGLT